MKTTIDLPDELVTEIKVEAARQTKKLKQLVPELLRAGLRAQRNPGGADRGAAERWLAEWVRLGQEATHALPPGPAASEILAEDRRRLDQR